MGIDSDLIRGHVDTIILNILAEGDKYGYEIIDDVEKKSAGSYELKQPTLYSCLKRMEGQGLIDSYWVDSEIGGRRHYYKLTEKGHETFENNQKEWLMSRSIIDSLIATTGAANASPTLASAKTSDEEKIEVATKVDNETTDKQTSAEEIEHIEEEIKNEETTQPNIAEDIYDQTTDFLVEDETINQELADEKTILNDEVSDESSSISENITTEINEESTDANDGNFDSEEYYGIPNTFNVEESEQTDLFNIASPEEIETKEIDIDKSNSAFEALSSHMERVEPEEDAETSDSLHPVEKTFDYSKYFSKENKSFFDANSNGEIKNEEFAGLGISSPTSDSAEEESTSTFSGGFGFSFEDKKEVESFDQAEEKTESQIEDKNCNLQESEGNEIRINQEEEQTFTPSFDNEKKYFDIKLDDEEDKKEDFRTRYEQMIKTNSSKEEKVSENAEANIETPIIKEDKKEEFLTPTFKTETVEDALHETKSTIEKENASLYEKLDNIKAYTPRFTDSEYKNILGGLTAYTSSGKTLKPKTEVPKSTLSSASWDKIKSNLEKDGIVVKEHTKREKEGPENRNYLLTNKIKMIRSWYVFCAMILLLGVTYLLADKLNYLSDSFTASTLYFIVAASVLLLIPVIATIQFYANPTKKHIPRYASRASILFSLLFFVQALIIIYAINLPFGFYSFSQIDYNHLNWLVPSVCTLILPLSAVVYCILFNSRRFHV